MVLARDHHRDPLAPARLGEVVLHLKGSGDLLAEAPFERLTLSLWRGVEDHPDEETPLGGRVLVDVDDVEPGVGQEAADGRDQPWPVRAGKQQA